MDKKTILQQAIDVPGFPAYLISPDGIVITKKTGHVKAISYDKKGYARVSLYVHDKCHFKQLHRLLALAFIPNPNNWPQVNHIDGQPGNNDLNNLEWCTAQYNVQDGFNRGRKAWNKDMKSINNMNLKDLAKVLPSLIDEAKSIWGEGRISKDATSIQEQERTLYRNEDWAYPMYLWHLHRMLESPDPELYLRENS